MGNPVAICGRCMLKLLDTFQTNIIQSFQSCKNSSAVNKGQQPAKTAGYWSIFGRLLSSHFTVNFGEKRKMRKRSNKNNCETSASNVRVKINPYFRSLKRVYHSHTRWKLIEGFRNACDIFTEQNPARNRLKIMKKTAKIIVKHQAQTSESQ